jgi:hypothetical protein
LLLCKDRVPMPRWICLCLLFPALLANPNPRGDGPTVIPNPASVSFGREMIFSATVQSARPVREAKLILEDSSARSFAYPATIAASDGYLISARRDLQAEPVFPFSPVTYWWEILLDAGDKIVSERQSLQYLDDRYSWRSLATGHATVEWVEGDARSAQDAAELLLMSLGTISAELATPIPDGVRLYIYPRLADFHSGLGKLAYGWEGAVSDPASGIILVAAAPGAEGRQALATLLPHEAVHILLGAKGKAAYASLPLWLVEGTAAGYEMAPRPEADQALREAADGGSLIPIETLCRSFPSDERPALLAYAESKSFVAYLRETYGSAAIRKGIEAYSAGADCAGGMAAATGKNLSALEKTWRARLSGAPDGKITTWALVAGGCVLLAGVLAVGWILRRRRKPLPKEGTTAA